MWALDVQVAATWMRDGGRALCEMDYEDQQWHYAAALDDKTETMAERGRADAGTVAIVERQTARFFKFHAMLIGTIETKMQVNFKLVCSRVDGMPNYLKSMVVCDS